MDGDSATVADVMVRRPKTFARTASADDIRRFFADDHVHAALIVDGEHLCSVVVRDDLDDAAARWAVDLGRLAGRTVGATDDAEGIRQWMLQRAVRRLAVVDESGNLLGLLCLKRSGRGFCSDADIAARAADRAGGCADVAAHEVQPLSS